MAQKHSKQDEHDTKLSSETKEKSKDGRKYSFSDDSDLASLAREFEEEEHIQDSPFIRKKSDPRRPSSESLAGANATPLPEQDAPFISSFQKGKKQTHEERKGNQTSAALDNFMKFDKKYTKRISEQRLDFSTEEEVEEESVLTSMSPVKIASVLEGKIRKNSKESSRSKTPTPSPRSPRTRLKNQAENAGLRLNLPGGLQGRKLEPVTSPLPTTASEISEYSHHPPVEATSATSPSTYSPLFSQENLHNVDELELEKPKDKKKTPPSKSKPLILISKRAPLISS